MNDMERKHSNSNGLRPSSKRVILALWQPSIGNLLERRGYVNAYNYEEAVSRCVFECLTSEQVSNPLLSRKGTKRRAEFEEDPDIDSSKRTKLDYVNWPKENGIAILQKGHLAAASNHSYNQNASDDTFLLSNIVPMCPNANEAIRVLEMMAQKFAKGHGKVYIATGPYFKKKSERECNFVKDDHKVRVPEGIFKVVVYKVENKCYNYFVRAFYIENSANSTSKKKIRLTDLNSITGLNLLEHLSDQIREERMGQPEEWWKLVDIQGDVSRNINRSGGR